MKRIKTLRSHAAHSRFLLETDETKDKEVPKIEGLPKSAFSFSPTTMLYWYKEKYVAIIETSHKNYEVWEV